jgi:hypothetical protein
MLMRIGASSGFTLALILASGCKDEGVDGLREAEAGMVPLVEAACGWMFGCCSDGERRFQLGEFTLDADNCTTRLVDAIKTGQPLALVESGLSIDRAEWLLLLARSINAGTVSVDRAAVAACAEDTSGRACNAPLTTDGGRCTPGDVTVVDPCAPAEMFQGRQGVGDECNASWECQPGLRCINFAIAGVCAESSDVGEHCFSDSECAGDLVCDYDSGTCVVGAKAGETCSFRDPADPVPGTERTRCAAHLVCDPSSSTCVGGFCTPGAPCFQTATHADCPENTWCVGMPGMQPTCRPLGSVGDPCVQDITCESGHCDPFESVCGTRLANGEPCFSDAECDSDFCDGICSPTLEVGEFCTSLRDAECDEGYCDLSDFDATCRAYAGEGQECPFGIECNPEADLACIEGSCRSFPLANGLPCGSNAQCESGVCFGNTCANGTPEGNACDLGGATPPCEIGTFCDIPEDDTAGSCVALRRTGQACERSAECWGECVVRYGQQMCDQTPAHALDEVWCGGA